MRLLVLGGTQFVGHAIVSAALGLGWEVTTFNRGMSGADVAGVRVLRGDRALAADLARLSAAGPWDAVIDSSGYVPREVLAASECLEPVAARYVFMSTVSVYRGWPVEPLSEASEVLYCPPDAGPDYGEDVEDGPTRYGYQKSGCELAVTSTIRPGALRSSPPRRGSRAARICRPAAVVAQQGRSGRPGACAWIAGQVNPAGRRSRSRRVRDPVSRRRDRWRLQRDRPGGPGNLRRLARGVRRCDRVGRRVCLGT